MGWMNEYEIDDAVDRYRDHPLLGPATQTLSNLRDVTNRNSDGWPYWRKPANAAKKLMDLIGGFREYMDDRERSDVTKDALKKAYTPIKSFRTSAKLDFEIVEVR